MKKSNKNVISKKLSLHKFSIAKLNNMNAIKGGTSGHVGTGSENDSFYDRFKSVGDSGSDLFLANG